MQKTTVLALVAFTLLPLISLFAQKPGVDSIVLKDIEWDKASPAGMRELNIPSGGSLLQGIIYSANGADQHPTLFLLHGYPGNEKNLDLAQVVRAHGWNVVYFDYRGSWASQGQFSFEHCVEDVVNAVAYCKSMAATLKIDTSRMVLFGHSMGGWITLKALQHLPGIQKGFVLSAWNIANAVSNQQYLINSEKEADNYFVLNKKSGRDLFKPVADNPSFYNLVNDAAALSSKQIIMLDEHTENKSVAAAIKAGNKNYFKYEVWQTDHPFTNKRVALMKELLAFLDK